MYAKNVTTLLLTMVKDGKLDLNLEDEVIRESMVCHGGEVVHPKVREVLGLTSLPAGGGGSS
jgi:NAD(P) transhydrogenase subunit alpha